MQVAPALCCTWQKHSVHFYWSSSLFISSECDCNNLADSCVYDKELGHGRCLNCKRNTAGPKCERCRDNFFRLTPSDDCQPCNCDAVGSASLQCDSTGQCICKPGVTGVKCDKCAADNFGFSQTGCRWVIVNVIAFYALTSDINSMCNSRFHFL